MSANTISKNAPLGVGGKNAPLGVGDKNTPLGDGGKPAQYESILSDTKNIFFNMASDAETGSLLRTLAASKPSASILELGTGTGLATSWMLHGMDKNARLISVENNEQLLAIAKKNINDSRIEFIFADGYEWLLNYKGEKFDLIFADTFPGKYDLFEETIALLNTAGIYVIDDMLPQPNWHSGHAE